MSSQVSIVIIFYNQANYVRRALRSVIDQTFKGLDIIVVDDGSEESIEPIVRGYENTGIRFFRKENGGAASARNLGVQKAKGEYIAFLDGDDLFLPHHVEQLMLFLQERVWPVCMVTSGHYVITKSGWVVDRRMPETDARGIVVPFTEMYTSCSIYHREVIERFGGFPEQLRINEDGALNSAIGQVYPVFGLAEVLTYYLVNESGKARRSLKDYDWAVDVMEKRLAQAQQTFSPEVMQRYRATSEKNLLLGFLSGGNLDAAIKWARMSGVKLSYASLSGCLAGASLKLRINLYSMVRHLGRALKALIYLPVSFRLHRQKGLYS
jgi:glycosyltransferase involved in cell wall biosynthesis